MKLKKLFPHEKQQAINHKRLQSYMLMRVYFYVLNTFFENLQIIKLYFA